MVSNPPPPTQNTDRQTALPKVGETRCYWCLLNPDLVFLYLDPVLASHLGEQADLLVGKSLLTYVHPDEQASAKLDLGSVLEERTLHGSVTRVRYSRLSRVRRQLGYTGPGPDWLDAEKIAVDQNYMAVDIVINYAADGLVLCFIHAAVDLTPRDNDEHHKTGWTNWCGTPNVDMSQIQLLFSRLQTSLPQPSTLTRVFQILSNSPDRSLCLSWPQERPGETASKDFARLAEGVQIHSSETDARTSCTRRYKSSQVMELSSGDKREVESVFIPHGAIIFACHKASSFPRNGVAGNSGLHQSGYHSTSYAPQGGAQYYEAHPQNVPQNTHVSSLPYPYSSHPQSPMASSYPPNPWMNMEPGNQYAHWGPSSVPNGAPVSSIRSSSYSTAAPSQQTHQQWASQSSYIDSGSPVSPIDPSAPSPGGMYPTSGPSDVDEQQPPSPPSDLVPAPRSGRRNNRDQYSNGGRTSGNPPVGITKCASCKATHSPEWRKGPSGKKDLCNACGLRFARSRAKKEGGSQRRRKDRAMSTLSSKADPSPSASPVSASYPGMRRGSFFEEGSFLSTSSAGSGSGNDSFSHAPSFEGSGMTPSPSPPSAGLHYAQNQSVNYPSSMATDPRAGSYGGHPSANQYYHLPGPPSHHLAQSAPHPHVSAHGHSGHHMPPARLDTLMSFHHRLSPMVSPSSPASNSPLSAGLTAASYERDKRHERDQDHLLMAQASLGHEQAYRMGKAYLPHDAPF
ncbi:uncharacterized protein BXZ73DRAFT_38854 [Epithele typhae]|uniref:uncharacterized protein n=1 Tax=Epithele typhae TaxID=378194 RepID=UPI0020087B7D|nr:uncharacterized protein BXZ73DRAFT_38854 [Epithele typhae]KAH9945242.1 hypothetical protein BXZ73DRAFT_38854 [Epithele typhae]